MKFFDLAILKHLPLKKMSHSRFYNNSFKVEAVFLQVIASTCEALRNDVCDPPVPGKKHFFSTAMTIAQVLFFFLFETGSHVAQAGCELLIFLQWPSKFWMRGRGMHHHSG